MLDGEPPLLKYAQQHIIELRVIADSAVELFEMLDVDGGGQVDIDEFCDGISRLASSDQPVEL